MAQITLDLSGRNGLVEKYQGDVFSTSADPQLRYIGESGQMADGFYNPFRKFGYLSPATAEFDALTGLGSLPINSIVYDPSDDIVYLSEDGTNIYQLDGLNDNSLSVYKTISTGTISDMVLYELNGSKALYFTIDSGVEDDGSYVGVSFIDTTNVVEILDVEVSSPSQFSPSYTTYLQDQTSAEASFKNNKGTRLAQSFRAVDVPGLSFDTIDLPLSRTGTGSGITIKVSLELAINDAPTSWGTGVSYAINDGVLEDSSYWRCIQAHTSSSTNQPVSGASWEDYWVYDFRPDGTTIASQTIDFTTIPSGLIAGEVNYTRVTFDSVIELTSTRGYYIIIEEVGTNMTASEKLAWGATISGTGTYTYLDAGTLAASNATAGWARYYHPTDDIWMDLNTNGDLMLSNHDNFGFVLSLSNNEKWSKTSANGSFTETYNQNQFLFLSDNNLVYWFSGNNVHTVDGSSSAGNTGRIVRNVLTFPSYFSISSVAETRSRMYIAVQTSDISSLGDKRSYTANRVGIFIWDKRSQVLGSSDFFYCPGAKEIKQLFVSSSGDVRAITVNSNNQTEIRGISGNSFVVIQTLGINAYPESRRSIGLLDHMSIWLGNDAVIYGFGKPSPMDKERLYRLADYSGQSASTINSGPIFTGYEYSSNPLTSIIFGVAYSTSEKVGRWYPYVTAATGGASTGVNAGNVYSKLEYLPSLSTLRNITIYCSPTTTADGSTIATIKLYKNQSTTPFSTKTVTNTEAARGYKYMELNEHNVNALQIEVEWTTTIIDPDEQFTPSIAIINYEPTTTQTKDNG